MYISLFNSSQDSNTFSHETKISILVMYCHNLTGQEKILETSYTI